MLENVHIHCAGSAIFVTFTLICRSPSNYLKFVMKCTMNAHVSRGPVFSRLRGSKASSRWEWLSGMQRGDTQVTFAMFSDNNTLLLVSQLKILLSASWCMPCLPLCLCRRSHLRMTPLVGDRDALSPACAPRPGLDGQDRFGWLSGEGI